MSAARRRGSNKTGAKSGAGASRGGARDRRGSSSSDATRAHVRVSPFTGGAPARIGLIVILVAALVAAWWFMRARDQRPTAARPAPLLPIAALLDSQRAAVASEQWANSVYWAGRLADAEPNDPMRMLGLGLAWHNWAWAGSPFDRARSATRSSLDRVRMEKHALALLDSAKMFARDNDEAARIRHWVGQIYEIYGLPVDAALGYQDALEFDPSFALTLPRARWVVARLRDPLGGGSEPAGGGVP